MSGAVQMRDVAGDAVPLRRPVPTALLLGILLVCGLVAFVDGFDMSIVPLTIPAMARAWGVDEPAFGYVLSAVSLGVAFGAALIAPLGDRLGRKPLLVGSLIVVVGSVLASATSRSIAELLCWRLLFGLGFGACYPTMTAIVLEVAPLRRRVVSLAVISSMLAFGGFCAGMVAPVVLETLGWRYLAVVGAVFGMIATVLAVLVLPRSGPATADPPATETVGAVVVPKGIGLRALWAPQHRLSTALMWASWLIFCLAFYGMIGWLPTVMGKTGVAQDIALRSASMVFPGAMLGHVLVGIGYDRYQNVAPVAVLSVAGIAILLLFPVVGRSGQAFFPWMLLVLGIGVGALQSMLSPITALIYPPQLLSSGLGWGMSVGRLGAISGPLVGAWALRADFAPEAMLLMLALPLSCTTILFAVLIRHGKRSS